MQTIRLSSKNQMVLPKAAREAMHLKGKDELLVVIKGEAVVIMSKPKKYATALSGAAKGIYRRDYLRKERKAW